jgi:type III secretion protein J
MLRYLLIAIIVVGMTTGCTDESLYSGLTEREANEMIALLHNAGIHAVKTSTNDQQYAVLTNRESFAKAIELLKTHGFPRNSFESLGDVFKKEGFVSSPLEERARLNYAQSQELSRTIESIDGVILARVHLAIPKENQLDPKEKPSSASVFIKHRRGIDLTDRESQIKALIVNSIEGLPYENVTVAMFTSNPIPVSRNTRPNQEAILPLPQDSIMYIGVGLIGSVIILTILLIMMWAKNRKQSTQLTISNSG